MDSIEKQEQLKGEENTCQDIRYLIKMGKISDGTAFRLILERLEYLESYVDDLKTANNLKDLR